MFHISTYPTAAEMAEVVLTTANGYSYTKRDACQLAYSIWLRFGRDDEASTQAWCKLSEGDTPVADFKRLVDAHLHTFLRERMPPNESSSPTANGEGG
jgi:hypothetical protein